MARLGGTRHELVELSHGRLAITLKDHRRASVASAVVGCCIRHARPTCTAQEHAYLDARSNPLAEHDARMIVTRGRPRRAVRGKPRTWVRVRRCRSTR